MLWGKGECDTCTVHNIYTSGRTECKEQGLEKMKERERGRDKSGIEREREIRVG